jgi:hypothetical protein
MYVYVYIYIYIYNSFHVQGLQWTLDEIEQYESNETKNENQKLLDNGFLLENQENEFDPLQAVLGPPPTYRFWTFFIISWVDFFGYLLLGCSVYFLLFVC